MSNTSFDHVAIDTNVFEQLLNPCENLSNHIDTLLSRLIEYHQVKLLTDCKRRIENEYGLHIKTRMKTSDIATNIRPILEYFFVRHEYVRIRVDQNDELMKKIKPIVTRGQGVDAIFVYVAFKKEKILITNDRNDIIDSRTKGDGLRRKKLLKVSKRAGKKNAGIWTSIEAVNEIC